MEVELRKNYPVLLRVKVFDSEEEEAIRNFVRTFNAGIRGMEIVNPRRIVMRTKHTFQKVTDMTEIENDIVGEAEDRGDITAEKIHRIKVALEKFVSTTCGRISQETGEDEDTVFAILQKLKAEKEVSEYSTQEGKTCLYRLKRKKNAK